MVASNIAPCFPPFDISHRCLGNAVARGDSCLGTGIGADRAHIVRRQFLASPVLCLFPASCPPTIAWFIPAVIVNSFQRQPWRTRPEVSEEVLERQPTLAHSDAPAAIVLKARTIGIAAAREHGRPARVAFADPSRPRVAMFQRLCVNAFPPKAPAGFGPAVKIGVRSYRLVPAIADAAPIVSSAAMVRKPKNGKTAVSAACNIPDGHGGLPQRLPVKWRVGDAIAGPSRTL
jgi:hypothetical protein